MRERRRLSEVVVPGRDYPVKVKMQEILDHEVTLTDFDHTVIYKEVKDEQGEVHRAVDGDYFLLYVRDGEVQKMVATGARPVRAILEVLDKAELPLSCTFRKVGRTYLVE